MKEDYVPNEKYRNMFGVERNGYGCERVDLYLAQLEVAFKKIREDNRNLKRDLAGQASAQGDFSLQAPPPQPQLQPQPDPEAARQLAEHQEYIAWLQAQNRLLITQLSEQAYTQQQAAALLTQITALRSETGELRQQLQFQPPMGAEPAYDEEQQNLIGRVLVDAQSRAEETVRKAAQEAEAVTLKAQQRVEELQGELQRRQAELQRLQAEHQRVFSQLQTERQRIYSQLQGTYFALRNALKDTDTEYRQRGEEFAAN